MTHATFFGKREAHEDLSTVLLASSSRYFTEVFHVMFEILHEHSYMFPTIVHKLTLQNNRTKCACIF